MKTILTNNEKTKAYFSGKADIVEVASGKQLFDEGMRIILKGGRLIHDPCKVYGGYRSLVFLMDSGHISAEWSIEKLKKCAEKLTSSQNRPDSSKGSIFSGIFQSQDLNRIKSL